MAVVVKDNIRKEAVANVDIASFRSRLKIFGRLFIEVIFRFDTGRSVTC